MYLMPQLSGKAKLSEGEVFNVNTAEITFEGGKDVVMQGKVFHTRNRVDADLKKMDEFLMKNMKIYPIQKLHIQAIRKENGEIQVPVWWESQNVRIGREVQPHYTPYKMVLNLPATLSAEDIKRIFSKIQLSVSYLNGQKDEYDRNIKGQLNTVLSLRGYNQKINHVTDVDLVKTQVGMRPVMGEGTFPDMLYTNIEDRPVEKNTPKKETILTTFRGILKDVQDEIQMPSVAASFHEAGARERTFLHLVVTMAKTMKESKGVFPWKFFAEKYTTMIGNFFGKDVLKNADMRVELQEMWKEVKRIAKQLSESKVLDRLRAVVAPKRSAGKAPQTFEERTANVKKVMASRVAREKEEEAAAKKAEEDAKAREQLKAKGFTPYVAPSEKPVVQARELSFQPTSFWEKAKGFAQKIFGR